MSDYERNPNIITQLSFETIRREVDIATLPEDMVSVALRMIHSCGMIDLLDDLVFSKNAGNIGRAALKAGANILADVEMVTYGISNRSLKAGNKVVCTLNQDGVAGQALERGVTRSSASVDLWRPNLEGAIVLIGNAPTALFRLLEILDQNAPHPAIIIAVPPGFIGAVDAKDALISNHYKIPYIVLRGRRGGSALAAAALNALAIREETA